MGGNNETTSADASSKDRILRAALSLFAQKSFEGARVDEIAHAAGVNKALIYYYFKSKEEILEALFQGAIQDFSKHIEWSVFLKPDVLDSDTAIDTAMDVFFKFIEERRELFTVAVMELLKDSERRIRIIELLGLEIEKQYKALENSFGSRPPSAQEMVTEFFTGFLPIIMFVILKEPWKQLYKQDDHEITALFKAAIRGTHIRYTYEMIKSRIQNPQ
jgi:AcrR family transcriptional regulator